MPTLRKRIGFLPRSEVQNIIEQISNYNKLSQSKVTGILVEEALRSRGVLNNKIKKLSFDFIDDKKTFFTANKTINSESLYEDTYIKSDEGSINEEVQMIKDFIEFKFFKNIMNSNKR